MIAVLIIALSACRHLDGSPTKEVMLQNELDSINWKALDAYPSFSTCDSLQEKSKQLECFFEFLTVNIQQRLSSDSFAMSNAQLDTIIVQVTVLPDSTVQFKPDFGSAVTYDTLKIDSVIKARLIEFPKITPAVKRGIPVKTRFTLPVILKVE